MKKLSKAAYQIEGQPMFKVLSHVLDLERQGTLHKQSLNFQGKSQYDMPVFYYG